jgi:hypothetical protein
MNTEYKAQEKRLRDFMIGWIEARIVAEKKDVDAFEKDPITILVNPTI